LGGSLFAAAHGVAGAFKGGKGYVIWAQKLEEFPFDKNLRFKKEKEVTTGIPKRMD